MTKRMSVKIDADVSAFNRSVKDMQRSMADATQGVSNSVEGSSTRLESFSKKMEGISTSAMKIGGDLTKKLTLPLVAAGTASVMMAADFESGMSEVSALSGTTGAELQMLEDLARQMGAETKFSALEATQGLKYMSLAGWDANEMAAGLEPMLKLAGAAGLDLGVASDIVTDALSMYGMGAEEAAKLTDVLAYTQANSNTSTEQLGDALVYVGATANAMGYDVEDTAAILGVFADQGLKGSKAGTTLNAVFRDMKKNSKDGAIAIGDTSVAIVDAEGNYRDYADIIEDVEKATEGMTAAERDAALAAIFGDEALKGVNMTLEAGSGKLRAFEDDIRGSEGAASEMYDTMNDNLKGSLEELKSALSEAAISLGEALTPAVEKGIEVAGGLIDKFNGLSDETKTVIAGIGIAIAVIGPLIMVFGALASAISAIAGAVALVSAPLLIAAAAIGAVVVAGGLLVNHLSKDAIPEVNLFGDEVSDTTAQVVGDFMDMTNGSLTYMKELAWGQQEITQEMVDDMGGKQQEITDTLLTAIEERHAEERAMTEAEFEKTTALTQDQKDQIMQNIDAHYENEKQATQAGHDRINEIMQTAADEGRELRKHEALEIEKITNDMNETAINTMSQSAVEQQAIKEQLVNSSTELSALEAAEVVRNATEKKNAVVDEANQQYDKTVAWAIRQRDEHGTMSDQEAAQVIADAERMRNKSVNEAESMHQEVVSAAQDQAKDHVNEVDWETGEVLSKYQVMKNKSVGYFSDLFSGAKEWWDKTSTSIVENAEESRREASANMEELKNNTIQNAQEAWSNAKEKWEGVKNSILNPIREARDTVSGYIETIKGFFTNLKLKIPKPEMPKLPSFSLKTSSKSILGKSITYPSGIDVNWYAKGGIATGPSIVGIGEAGDEAILPLSNKSKMKPFAQAVASMISSNGLAVAGAGGGGGGDTIITGNTFVVREEADIKKIAQELKRLDDRESRSRGRRGIGN